MGKKSLGGKKRQLGLESHQQKACWTSPSSLFADRPRQSLDHSHQAGIPGRICNHRGSKPEFAAQNVERNRRRASISTVTHTTGGLPWMGVSRGGASPPFQDVPACQPPEPKQALELVAAPRTNPRAPSYRSGAVSVDPSTATTDDQRILLNALKGPRYPDRYSGRGPGFPNVSDLRRDEWERADSYPRDGSEGIWHCHTDLLSRCVLYRFQPVQGKLHGHCRDMVVAVQSSGKKVSPCMSFTARRPGEVTAAQFGLVAPSTGPSVVPGVPVVSSVGRHVIDLTKDLLDISWGT